MSLPEILPGKLSIHEILSVGILLGGSQKSLAVITVRNIY